MKKTMVSLLILCMHMNFSYAMEQQIKEFNDALKNHNLSKIKLLVSNNKKLLEKKTKTGNTPIQIIIEKIAATGTTLEAFTAYTEIGEFLIKESSTETINHQNSIGATALIDAVYFTGRLPILNKIINALLAKKDINLNAQTKKEIVNKDNIILIPEGSTALRIAINKLNADLATKLINKGADVNKQLSGDFDYPTPLLSSILETIDNANLINVTKNIIEHNANIHGPYNKMNLSPLILAASLGQTPIVELLIKKGADSTHQLTKELKIFLTNKEITLPNGSNALSAAQLAQKSYDKTSQEYKNYEQTIQLLKKAPQKTKPKPSESSDLIKSLTKLEQSLSNVKVQLR